MQKRFLITKGTKLFLLRESVILLFQLDYRFMNITAMMARMEVMLGLNVDYLSSRLILILVATVTSNVLLGDLVYYAVADQFF